MCGSAKWLLVNGLSDERIWSMKYGRPVECGSGKCFSAKTSFDQKTWLRDRTFFWVNNISCPEIFQRVLTNFFIGKNDSWRNGMKCNEKSDSFNRGIVTFGPMTLGLSTFAPVMTFVISAFPPMILVLMWFV